MSRKILFLLVGTLILLVLSGAIVQSSGLLPRKARTVVHSQCIHTVAAAGIDEGISGGIIRSTNKIVLRKPLFSGGLWDMNSPNTVTFVDIGKQLEGSMSAARLVQIETVGGCGTITIERLDSDKGNDITP